MRYYAVLVPQQGNPEISLRKESYTVGEVLVLNCTSAPAHPPPSVLWLINGHEVSNHVSFQFFLLHLAQFLFQVVWAENSFLGKNACECKCTCGPEPCLMFSHTVLLRSIHHWETSFLDSRILLPLGDVQRFSQDCSESERTVQSLNLLGYACFPNSNNQTSDAINLSKTTWQVAWVLCVSLPKLGNKMNCRISPETWPQPWLHYYWSFVARDAILFYLPSCLIPLGRATWNASRFWLTD